MAQVLLCRNTRSSGAPSLIRGTLEWDQQCLVLDLHKVIALGVRKMRSDEAEIRNPPKTASLVYAGFARG